jgi:tryptophanyl-tRNA synthetase
MSVLLNKMPDIAKGRVFSGIQPTGDTHIGNYLGAMRNWVRMQNEYECIFCIVDLHAITVSQDPATLKVNIRELAGLLIAAGINPERSALFIQSAISAHAELAWILNCFTPMGWMQRMTQFKEKSENAREQVSVGVFDYPALMAADILLYNTDYVPVGDDQKQHVELTRDIAIRFNGIYGETFKVPEPTIPPVGARIMGLDDPAKKMSKSEDKQGHSIYLLDSPEDIRAKIMRATTDSQRGVKFDESRPGLYNLLVIYEVFTKLPRAEIESQFEGRGYGDLKKGLAEVVIEGLRPLQTRYREITADPRYLEDVLAKGADRVRPIAEGVLGEVKRKVGVG